MSKPRQNKPASHIWVDAIPEGWSETRLRFVANISNSNVDKKSYEGQLPVRLCNYTDVYYNERIEPELEFMHATATPAEIKKFELREGDVIITKDSEDPNDIGVPAYVLQDMPGVVCGYHLSVIRTSDPVTAAFLQYSIMSHVNKAQLYVDTPGVTRFGLDQDTIKSILVLLPPAEERRQIVEMLGKETRRIDGLLEKKTRFIALLKEKRLAFSDAAVTGSGALKLRDSGIPWASRIPARWEVKKGKYLFQEMARPVNEEDEIITAFRDGQVCLRRKRRTGGYTFAVKEVGYQHIKRGDLVIHTMDAFAGAIGVSEDDGKATGEYAVCKPRSSDVSPEYYALLLRCMARRNYIYVLCPSVRERAPRFRFVRFAPVQLPVPPIDEQIEIVEEIDRANERFDKLIEKTERSIALLKEKRAALITAAVTGKIDVRAAA